MLFFIFIDIVFCMCERPILSQITLIIADKTQNNINLTTIPNCLSLRNNAACCIPLRDLRYLRENTRKSTQSICTEETPMSPADLADLRRQNPKPQQHSQTVFLCEIMQLAAFLCVICVICGRITRKSTQAICHKGNPYVSRRSR